jgi:hypothetical protein
MSIHKEKISIFDLLKFNTELDNDMMDHIDLIDLVEKSIDRTINVLPNGMRLTKSNKIAVINTLRMEIMYQMMLYREGDEIQQ